MAELENKQMANDLFHEIMKCSNLVRASLHHNHNKTLCSREKCVKEECQLRGHHHSEHHGADAQKIGQFRLLRLLLVQNGINQKEIAELLLIRPASVSELLTKLEVDNYIERKQNEEDKRVTNIFLTEEGRLFAEKMKEKHLEAVKDIFSALDEKEQKQLLELISKINSSIVSQIKGDDLYEHLSYVHRHCGGGFGVGRGKCGENEGRHKMHGRRGH